MPASFDNMSHRDNSCVIISKSTTPHESHRDKIVCTYTGIIRAWVAVPTMCSGVRV